uniref:Uncharacterized protein n=1 Tax=Rhizophora mucronata TaxID=61149 RepID=A0A2P2QPU2_RHIMU
MEETIKYKDGDIEIQFVPQIDVRLIFEKENDLKLCKYSFFEVDEIRR